MSFLNKKEKENIYQGLKGANITREKLELLIP